MKWTDDIKIGGEWLDKFDKRYIDDAFDEKARHRKIEKCKSDRSFRVFVGLPLMFILLFVNIFLGFVIMSFFMTAILFFYLLANYQIRKMELRHLLIIDRLMEKEASTMKKI